MNQSTAWSVLEPVWGTPAKIKEKWIVLDNIKLIDTHDTNKRL